MYETLGGVLEWAIGENDDIAAQVGDGGRASFIRCSSHQRLANR